MIKFIFLLNLISAISFAANAEKKKIYFIGTGGTIAGVSANPNDINYDAGKATLEAILKSVPEITDWADISGEQLKDEDSKNFINVPSNNITENHWLMLARKANWALTEGGFDSVIITHGTDTLEETAFFMHLSNSTNKPIILVGAARPSTHINADGPENIRNAVRIALNLKYENLGAIVAMDNRAYSAIDFTKVNRFDFRLPLEKTFTAPHFGEIAEINPNTNIVYWNEVNFSKLENLPLFRQRLDVSKVKSLPKAPILVSNIGNDSAELIDLYIRQGVLLFVLEGNGAGAVTKSIFDKITELAKNQSPSIFVRSSRVVKYSDTARAKYLPNSIGAGGLRPAQAKILLQLVYLKQAAVDSNPVSLKSNVEAEIERLLPYLQP
jgi:L-asparaginase